MSLCYDVDEVIKVYENEEFQKRINSIANIIEGILNSFITEEFKNESLKDKISKKINCRIKSSKSLKEKLRRKNYVDIWGGQDSSSEEIQDLICKNLPDLIGFRINCYFKENEITIYHSLTKYLEKNNIRIEEDPNLKQKNGHEIYKIACQYEKLDKTYCFEIQVKSLLHDVWGEVEHKLVYKSVNYDSRNELKSDIINQVYTILDGADKQLNKIYSFKYKEIHSKFELYYSYSKNIFNNKESILGEHYNNFFTLIYNIKDFENYLDKYLGNKLLKNENYTKKKLIYDIKYKTRFQERYNKEIDKYKLKMVCDISRELFEFQDNIDFMGYLLQEIDHKSHIEDIDEFSNIEEENEFAHFSDLLQVFNCIRTKESLSREEEIIKE